MGETGDRGNADQAGEAGSAQGSEGELLREFEKALEERDLKRALQALRRGARFDQRSPLWEQSVGIAATGDWNGAIGGGSMSEPEEGLLSSSLIKALVAAGAPIEGRNESGASPLMRAALNGRAQALKTLIELGADVRALSARGSCALVYAVSAGETEAIRELLAHGADPRGAMERCQSVSMIAPDYQAFNLLVAAVQALEIESALSPASEGGSRQSGGPKGL